MVPSERAMRRVVERLRRVMQFARFAVQSGGLGPALGRIGRGVLDHPGLLGQVENPRHRRTLARLALSAHVKMLRELLHEQGSVTGRDLFASGALDERLRHSQINVSPQIQPAGGPSGDLHLHMHAPGGQIPDPTVALQKFAQKLRARGGRL